MDLAWNYKHTIIYRQQKNFQVEVSPTVQSANPFEFSEKESHEDTLRKKLSKTKLINSRILEKGLIEFVEEQISCTENLWDKSSLS